MMELFIMWSNKNQNTVFNMYYVEFSETCIELSAWNERSLNHSLSVTA